MITCLGPSQSWHSMAWCSAFWKPNCFSTPSVRRHIYKQTKSRALPPTNVAYAYASQFIYLEDSLTNDADNRSVLGMKGDLGDWIFGR